MQAYPMQQQEKERESDGLMISDQAFDSSENTIEKMCMNLIRSRKFEALHNSVLKSTCYAVYERMIEENRSFDRLRRFFSLPIAKNQNMQLPPGETASNTGFKYGRK
jgi:hypothetical protein